MEIRKINSCDNIRKISRVYEQSWKSTYKGIIPQDYLDNLTEGQWCESLRTCGRNSVILLDKDKIVGTSSYSSSRDEKMAGCGEIISIYILPEYCGHGYGTSLLNASIEGLRSMGFSDIFLWVLKDNIAARRFYEKNGFQANDECKVSIGGKTLTEVRYIKKLLGILQNPK